MKFSRFIDKPSINLEDLKLISSTLNYSNKNNTEIYTFTSNKRKWISCGGVSYVFKLINNESIVQIDFEISNSKKENYINLRTIESIITSISEIINKMKLNYDNSKKQKTNKTFAKLKIRKLIDGVYEEDNPCIIIGDIYLDLDDVECARLLISDSKNRFILYSDIYTSRDGGYRNFILKLEKIISNLSNIKKSMIETNNMIFKKKQKAITKNDEY